MEKFQALMMRYFVPLATKINAQRHVSAVRDAFTLAFPLTMAGSLVVLINYVFLSPDGFVASILHLDKFIPNLVEYQEIFNPIVNGTTNIMAIIIAFLTAYELARIMGGDEVLSGITSMASFFILYPAAQEFKNGGMGLTSSYFGAQGLFVALFIGLIVAELLTKMGNNEKLRIKMPDTVPPAVAKSFNILFPIMIVLALSGLLNFFILKISPDGIQSLIYNAIQAPLVSLGSSMGTILTFVVVQQFLWVLGIHGPNTLSALRSVMFTEQGLVNLEYVVANGTAWGAPYPVTWAGINDAFGNIGGSGATLGLIIAVFIAGRRNKAQYQICKMSFLPGLFNINEPIVFGLPIVMNPIFVVPFILSPIVCNIMGYLCIMVFKIIPPIAYTVAWTTPGFLIPFLGSGANNFMALFIGFVCLAVSTLIYLPFVMANSRAVEEAQVEGETE